MEFILDILNQYIPDSTRLVLNADDLLCSSLKPHNRRAFFGIDLLPGEVPEPRNLVQDVRSCPRCGSPLEWEFRRYHHIGRARCPQCGLASPVPAYRVTALDQHSRRMTVQGVDGPQDFPLPNTNLINVYNALSAVALLCEFGLPKERVAQCMDKLTIVESRYNEVAVNGRRLIWHLAKGPEPHRPVPRPAPAPAFALVKRRCCCFWTTPTTPPIRWRTRPGCTTRTLSF